MISNASLSAFSASNLRPVEPRTNTAPVTGPDAVRQVRSQQEVNAPSPNLSATGRTPVPPAPGAPMPRGSLLDLSV